MELVYRGVRYHKNKSALSIATKAQNDLGVAEAVDAEFDLINCDRSKPTEANGEIIGNQLKSTTKNHSPLWTYCQQLFFGAKTKRVYSPILFWYIYQSQSLENCWQLDSRKMLENSWYLTLALFKTNCRTTRPIQLKYRGVTYYR